MKSRYKKRRVLTTPPLFLYTLLEKKFLPFLSYFMTFFSIFIFFSV